MFKLSMPTRKQVVDSIERVVLVFVATGLADWLKQPTPFSHAAFVAVWGAGAAAVYQAVKSLATTL